jgi:hypothetical protein
MKNASLNCFLILAGIMAISCDKKESPTPQKPANKTSGIGQTISAQSAKISTLPYVDDWARSGSLSEFKKGLLAALDAGDQSKVLEAFSKRIELNPGTQPGPDGLVEFWGLDGSKEKLAPLKAILDSILTDGGCLSKLDEDSIFLAPHTACLSDSQSESCGEMGCGIVSSSGASIRVTTEDQSDVAGQLLPYEIVSEVKGEGCDEHFTKCKWRSVTRANGQTGFAPYDAIKTQRDGLIKIGLEKSGWKIQVLRKESIPADAD